MDSSARIICSREPIVDCLAKYFNFLSIGISMEFCGCCLSIVNSTFSDIVRANSAARILYSYFDIPDLAYSGSDKAELSGSFSVQNLHFAYPSSPDHEVILMLEVNMEIQYRCYGPWIFLHRQESRLRSLDHLVFVSFHACLTYFHSGCGKSTLIALLERFYEQRKGDIVSSPLYIWWNWEYYQMIDGFDHRRIALPHLRHHIALVGQEPVLFEVNHTLFTFFLKSHFLYSFIYPGLNQGKHSPWIRRDDWRH